MAATFISSRIYLEPGYPGNHPLAIARLAPVMGLCRALGWLDDGAYAECPIATDAQLARFHDAAYLAAFAAATERGRATAQERARFGLGSIENPIFAGLDARARASVGGSILAAEIALKGGIAYHPGGGTHHAMADRASGFCYFNDPVFAILRLLDAGLTRVLYADLDAHHGDGVQAAMAHDPRVMTLSVHEDGRWPFTGGAGDRGNGHARNFPVPRAMNDSEFAWLMDNALLPLARGFAPQAVVVTVGADALAGDPLSSLALSNGALWEAVMALTRLSPASVILGGGGYNPWTLARAWAGLWARLSGQPVPDDLPPAARAVLAPLSCDLVDEDEVQPAWLTTLADAPNPGPVRPAFAALARAALSPDPAELPHVRLA
ncbi:MAG: acetoin utilization protein AcuC [Limimaricola sp.]|uniref:acetoin utilization protein AcuC n=1 Tax=Limimaricola sp. TaxID=2211665 RepID=UPI001DF381D1|nr:acetoin utilization protein AcuC [Limimaricola sp.]MBI1418940.1 acetoin utilization protein AcuC [Limimaricola sp.]